MINLEIAKDLAGISDRWLSDLKKAIDKEWNERIIKNYKDLMKDGNKQDKS